MVGAFEIRSAKGGSLRGGVEVYGAGAGASGGRHEGYTSSDGDLRACQRGHGYAPPEDCESLLQIELLPVPPAEVVAAGTCPVDMAFVEVGEARGFCLDTHEVTVRDYARCAADHTCSEAPASVDWPGISEDEHARYDELCNTDRSNRRSHPVNCVTWDQAASYCRAQGKRLPQVREWKWAARGGEQNRTYPWGEDLPGPSHVNACGKECAKQFGAREQAFEAADGNRGTAPVGSYRDGVGRWGLLDMSGNVLEWTDHPIHSSGTLQVMGGSALSGAPEALESAASEYVQPSTRRFDLGFRCAADPRVDEGKGRRRKR
ncbi:SUMF1/EgtB/PvdO family nonheme iron enzyme [Pseudenhygromyxa sp. WMMC2535]|nr:SUMF1/EgtB/PvdO family nonheme iron enzyme [Pseudenhygromyxa sp. WMMC2535]